MNIDILAEFDVKFKKYDKKRTAEGQLSDLITELKSIGIKIIENSKLQNGYGEGVCLVLTQLLDKYLINQNFIFKKPKLLDQFDEYQGDFDDIVLEEYVSNGGNLQSDKTQSNFGKTTLQNNSTKNRFFSGTGKRYHSAMSNTTQGNYSL